MFFFGPFAAVIPLLIIFVVVRAVTRYRRSGNSFVQPSADDVPGLPRSPGLIRGTSQDARIFKLAYKLKGRLTISDIVVETGMPLHDAQQLIESMIDNAGVEGAVRSSIDSHFMAQSIIGMCNGLGDLIIRDPDIDAMALARKTTDLLLHGAVPDQPQGE